jgi:hypothetical protein
LVVPQSPGATARLAPAETASDGLAVEAYVLARLLGLKLLTLEALVLVSPAAVRGGDAESSAFRQPRASVRSSAETRSRTTRRDGLAPGSGLAGAARLLDECADELRRLRAGGRQAGGRRRAT